MTQINLNVTEQRDRKRDTSRARTPYSVGLSRCHGVTTNRDTSDRERDSTALRPTRHDGNTEDFTKPHLDPGLNRGRNATNSPKLNREAAGAVVFLTAIWALAAWLAYAVVTAQ